MSTVCARRGLFSAEAIPAAPTENRKMNVVNRRGSYQQASAQSAKKAEGKKRRSPCTPFREKGKGKESDRRGSSWNRLSRADARVKAAQEGGHAGRVTLPMRVRAALDADLDAAVRAFGGTAADRRLWAAIAWRVGVEEFHFALADKLAEDATDNATRRPAAAFQAFLNARFPKADTGRKETPTACKRASATATACLRTKSRWGLPSVARSAQEGGAA